MGRGHDALACLFFAASTVACGSSTPHADGPSDGGVVDVTVADAPAPDSAGTAGDAALLDAGPSVHLSVTVDPTQKVGEIRPEFVGLSYEKSRLATGLFRPDNGALVALFRLLGPSLLRIGGDSVDDSVWPTFDGGAAADAATPVAVTPADVDALGAFARSAGWQVLYGVNLKLSSPSAAADEARYAATALGGALASFEIGNEPDLYTKVASSGGTWTLPALITDWQQFESAMAAAVPSAYFSGPGSASHVQTWTVPFSTTEAPLLETITQHYYLGDGQAPSATLAALLQPNPALATELGLLKAAAIQGSIPGGFRLSECNSFSGGGVAGVSNAYASALWAVDFLFENAMAQTAGVNFHGGGSSPGNTPIADDGQSVIEARPLFYGLLFFAKIGQGPVVRTSGSATALDFSSYAVLSSGARTSVVLSNKDPVKAVRVVVDTAQSLTVANATRLEGPSLGATSGVTLGGSAIASDGGFLPTTEALPVAGTLFTIDLPPASAALVVAE